jgi:hypothetical protein
MHTNEHSLYGIFQYVLFLLWRNEFLSEANEQKSKLIVETTFTIKARTHFQLTFSSYRLIGRGLLIRYTVACFLYLKFWFRPKIWQPAVVCPSCIFFFHFFPPGATQPIVGVYFTALYRGSVSSRTRLLDHIQRRATFGRTPLNE